MVFSCYKRLLNLVQCHNPIVDIVKIVVDAIITVVSYNRKESKKQTYQFLHLRLHHYLADIVYEV